VGRLVFSQGGTISSSTVGLGDGDLSRVALWRDTGDGAFNPAQDVFIGAAVQGPLEPFESGISIPINSGGAPYLTVTTATVKVHVVADIGAAFDLSGAQVKGHTVSLTLPFDGVRDRNGNQMSAGQEPSNPYPMSTREVTISGAVIPLPSVFDRLLLAPNGYPAFAVLDSSGNVIRMNNIPQADAGRWMTSYTSSMTNCAPGQPLIDINGDGNPDNFDYYGSGKCVSISLNNTGLPSFDIDDDRLLDFEINIDYIPDGVARNGTGRAGYFLGDYVNNQDLRLAVSELGAVPFAWSYRGELPARWNKVSGGSVASYELALGANFQDPTAWKNWQQTGAGLAAELTGTSLDPGKFTRLTSRIDGNSAQFTVENADVLGVAAGDIVYVGNEIMRVTQLDGRTFRIDERGVQGSAVSPHTAWGETVSNRAYVLSLRALMSDGSYAPSERGVPILFYRIDITPPVKPGPPEPQLAKGQSRQTYTLQWDQSADEQSGVMSYEIQEREGISPVWKTIGSVPGYGKAGSVRNTYIVGDPEKTPGETPRPLSKYYTYRVRAWNFAGRPSEWSEISTPAGTQIGEELVSKVSNFPNPVDTRKGGVEGSTKITYELNDDAEVTITIYDLLGYLVWERKYSSGQMGGRQGPNFVLWDGKNGLGGFVAKGGYIVRVKASSPKGSKIITRKIGVIH
jgi:hypothetical protein